MEASWGVVVAVLAVAVLEGARALGIKLAELLVSVGAVVGVLAATVYVLLSLRLAAVMERVRRL